MCSSIAEFVNMYLYKYSMLTEVSMDDTLEKTKETHMKVAILTLDGHLVVRVFRDVEAEKQAAGDISIMKVEAAPSDGLHSALKALIAAIAWYASMRSNQGLRIAHPFGRTATPYRWNIDMDDRNLVIQVSAGSYDFLRSEGGTIPVSSLIQLVKALAIYLVGQGEVAPMRVRVLTRPSEGLHSGK